MKRQTTKLAVQAVLNANPARTHSPEQQAHIEFLADIGAKIVLGSAAVGEMYFQAAEYMRKHSLAKELVFDTWKELGFVKTRISEIYRIANSPNDIWREYEAKRLGFKQALNLTRGTLRLLLTDKEKNENARFLDAIPVGGTEEALPEDGKAKPASAASSGVVAEGEKQTDDEKMSDWASKLARIAENNGVRTRTFKKENGYFVKVWRGPKVVSRGGKEQRPAAQQEGDETEA